MPRKKTTSKAAPKDVGTRIQKVLADAGVASRRASEQLILDGRVSVNGRKVTSLPCFVQPGSDRIEVDGRVLHGGSDRSIYVMLYKPRGVVSTNNDPEGRTRAIDLVRHPSGARLYPVGRLDMDSTGLLLLTNDGELANRLTHPRYEVHKGYEVTVSGRIGEADLQKLREGLFLPFRASGGRRTSRSRLSVIKRDRDRTHLYMELREGRNRQIRRMMLKVGHPVKKLQRVRMGPLKLSGLQSGHWRELKAPEVKALKKAAFGQRRERSRVQSNGSKEDVDAAV
ncbi:MAG: pseudouridine synthase [Phycisphaerae bacterium]|nr:pseudouridine synthase [Phycisphaerae bacterium]